MNARCDEDVEYEHVLDSYHRCEAAGGLFDSFYDIFLAKSPEIAPKFAKTNMEKQKQVAMASVLMALRLRTGDAVAKAYILEIAKSHGRRGHDVRPELYSLWLDALCAAVQEHDPLYSLELENQWRQAMRPAIELMISEY